VRAVEVGVQRLGDRDRVLGAAGVLERCGETDAGRTGLGVLGTEGPRLVCDERL